MDSDLQCPRCQGGMIEKNYETARIDLCKKCGGAWLDSGELEMVLAERREAFKANEVVATLKAAQPGVPSHEHATVEHCPICNERMNPLNFNYSSGIVVDLCPQGHGIWFDKKELDLVQGHFEHWADQKKKVQGHFAAELLKEDVDVRAASEAAQSQGMFGKVKLFRLIANAIDTVLEGR